MGRTPTITDTEREQIRALRRAGTTYTDLQAQVGHSLGTLYRICSGTPYPKRRKRGKPGADVVSAPAVVPHDVAAPGAVESLTDEQLMALLDSELQAASVGARSAREGGDMSAAASASRLVVALAGARCRLVRPEPPPDPNAHPDMVAAGERAVEKLDRYLEDLRLGKR